MAKNAASEDALGTLHNAFATYLGSLLSNPEAPPSAAELAVINAFLKNNDISCAVSATNAVGKLKEQLKGVGAPPEVTAKDKSNALDGVLDLAKYRAGNA